MTFSLKQRVAVVTGSGRGIGRTIAEVFAGAGAKVLIATRTRSSGQETVERITASGNTAALQVCDLSTIEGCRAAIAGAVERFGALDVLVHNAGVYPICRIEEMTPAVLDETLNVNLKAAFWLTREALPHLRKSPAPRILFTSSVTGPRVALPGLAHYAASKSGLNGFIRSAAMELAREGITVNGIEPGLIRTEAIDALGDEKQTSAMAAQIPLKRFGTTSEIAHAMLYFASEHAGFTTGQTLVIDGGALLPENSSALD